jgi:myo-inositol-1(or 4)-monophosphatase
VNDPELALAAAEAGAAVVRAGFGGELTRIAKGGGDLVTHIDLASERAILDLLREHRPDDPIDSEEAGRNGPDRAGRRWLVDPICGTLNFAAGTGPLAVNVALHLDGADEPSPGASADPLTGETFWTDGHAAWIRRHGTDHRCAPSPVSRLVDVNAQAPPGARTAAVVVHPGLRRAGFQARVVSSSVALAWVAAGRRAAYVTGGDLRANVHFAAPLAVCLAAGCVLTSIDGGPLYTGPGGVVAACDRETHAAVLALITEDEDLG